VRYGHLIDTAIGDLEHDPMRPGGRWRPELGAGVRSYHLRFSRQRARVQGEFVRSPRHLLIYRSVEGGRVQVVRLLHDACELAGPLN